MIQKNLHQANDNLEKWFFGFWVRKLRTSFLLIFLIIVSWIFSMMTIPKESSPEISIWVINIAVSYPGVDPETMDSLITEKIENEISDIDGIKKISSTSSVGTSLVSVELDTWVDTTDTMTEIKDEVDRISFPEDASDPTVVEISTNNDLIYEALIYWDENKFDIFTLTQKAKIIQTQLEGLNWISDISIGWLGSVQFNARSDSGEDYTIKVLLDKAKVELLGLSIPEVVNAIKANNKDVPIWNFDIWKLNYDFVFEWELEELEDLKNVVIRQSEFSQLVLSDIAQFKLEYPGDSIKKMWFYNNNGYNYISVTFNKSKGTNVFAVSWQSKEALEKLMKWKEFEGLSVEYSKDMGELIMQDYENLSSTALTTIVLVFITIMFFVWLREWIIASFLIPLAFLITFLVLDTLGLTLNFLTNFSLVLTLWIAIDTVIVIIEWASEKMSLWYHRRTAILMAIRDFKSPLISGTMTTLAAFLPMMFLPWVVWKFLSYIPITVFSTLLAALILSLTLSSALFSIFMKSKPFYYSNKKAEKNLSDDDKQMLDYDRSHKTERKHDHYNIRERFLHFLGVTYEKILLKVLHKLSLKLAFVFVPILLLISTFVFLSPQIGFVLFPGSDEWIINVDIEWQSGLDKESLEQYVPYIDDVMKPLRELKVYYVTVKWNSISVYVDLLEASDRKDLWLMSVFEVEKYLDKTLWKLRSEWLDVSVSALRWGPPTWNPVWVKLVADSAKRFDTLKMVSDDFEKFLQWLPGTKNVVSSSSDAPGQFVFEFNKDRLANIWLNQDDLLSQLYFYTNGLKAGSIKSDFEDNEIVVLFEQYEDTLSPEDVENIILDTKVWKVRVGDFASFEFKRAVNAITREDGNIIITVWSDFEEWFLPSELQPKFDEYAQNYVFPQWISYIKSWEAQENMELIMSTVRSLFITLFLIFSILVLQFNSYKQPAIVLYSIVLAMLWVNIWLFLTWNPYSMPFGIWFIALTWVVVNDAIILIDRINKWIRFREQYFPDRINYVEQIILWGKSRLQPIIVTTLTTVFWILPLAIQDEFWAALGFTIIFWLFVWSLMTLFVVPILYSMVELRWKIKKWE